ncbi:MAG: AlpA family phage regulatory protein [Sphingobium sp.]|nr:AlpA family phage regulatory protein [Sphingobium sp.]
MNEDRYIRRSEVEALTGLSRASIYRMMAEGRFVRPYRIGKSAVRWRYSDIKEWLDIRPLANRNQLLCKVINRLITLLKGI